MQEFKKVDKHVCFGFKWLSLEIAMDIEIAANWKVLMTRKLIAYAIQNDLSSAIHWSTLENTKFDAQTQSERRQKSSAAGEVMWIERKLKRIYFTLFSSHSSSAPFVAFISHTFIGMSECVPRMENRRIERNERQKKWKTTCGTSRPLLLLLLYTEKKFVC